MGGTSWVYQVNQSLTFFILGLSMFQQFVNNFWASFGQEDSRIWLSRTIWKEVSALCLNGRLWKSSKCVLNWDFIPCRRTLLPVSFVWANRYSLTFHCFSVARLNQLWKLRVQFCFISYSWESIVSVCETWNSHMAGICHFFRASTDQDSSAVKLGAERAAHYSIN